MSNKLDELLEAINKWNLSEAINKAYNAYMEERNKLPQVGQEIEVRRLGSQDWMIRKVIGFKINGEVVTENASGYVTTWEHYRLPTQKKKYKVLKGEIFPFVVAESDTTDLPIITTFED